MVSFTIEDSTKCGCNYTATKRISKTASITSISKTQRATRFNVWSNIKLIAVVILMTQLLTIGQVDATSMRPRQLRKRHSIATVDWENPCGGVFEGTYSGNQKQKKTSVNLLRKATRHTYQTLHASKEQWINTSDIRVWFSHNQTYKFLPKLRANSNVALKRWYYNMQTYVAAFSYLHTTQRKFDGVTRNNQESNISKELKSLLDDARIILCEIESTINHTTPYTRAKKFTSLSLEDMNKLLKFRTKKQLAENLYQVDSIDLKFAKFYFMDYLKNMWMILRTKNKMYLGSNSNSNSADVITINSNSKSESSNERNSSRRHHLGARRRPGRRQNSSRQRQRLNKNTSLSIA